MTVFSPHASGLADTGPGAKKGITMREISEITVNGKPLQEILGSEEVADLSGADLSWANLSGALYSDATQWPDGFDPVAAGAKKVDQELPDKVSTDASRHA